jgi:hypothetical protein
MTPRRMIDRKAARLPLYLPRMLKCLRVMMLARRVIGV